MQSNSELPVSHQSRTSPSRVLDSGYQDMGFPVSQSGPQLHTVLQVQLFGVVVSGSALTPKSSMRY